MPYLGEGTNYKVREKLFIACTQLGTKKIDLRLTTNIFVQFCYLYNTFSLFCFPASFAKGLKKCLFCHEILHSDQTLNIYQN